MWLCFVQEVIENESGFFFFVGFVMVKNFELNGLNLKWECCKCVMLNVQLEMDDKQSFR